MTELAGLRVLVVGASGGLGAPLSRGLADAGALLTLGGRSLLRLKALGLDDAHLVTADLQHPQAADTFVAGAIEAYGGLDGVVFAAGVVAFGGVADLDDDVVDELLLVNYLAPARLARTALPHLPAGGFIVNLSAVVAEQPVPNMAAYCASKAALTAFDAVLRMEARRRRVRVIDARPPHTETGLAGHPIAGTAPRLPQGLSPDAVATRILQAVTGEETDLPSSAFA